MLTFRSERVTDTMGRMHSDAQFAGILLAPLALLLRSISKRLPVKPAMTIGPSR